MEAMADLIQRAYAIFHRYPRKFPASTMMWTVEDPQFRDLRRRVKAVRLRQLDPLTLCAIVSTASLDSGAFKHFLPRLLECVAEGLVSFGELSWRLQPDDLYAWTEAEAGILREFLTVYPETEADQEPLIQACEARLAVSRAPP
jgi:hypothetical protein